MSEKRRAASVAILLIDHGSRRPEANDSLVAIADHLRALGGARLIVRHAHLALSRPTVPEAFDDCVAAGAMEVIAMPYLLSPGRHASEDIPRLVFAAASRHPKLRCRVTPPLGVDPLLAALVLERCGLKGSADRPLTF